MLTRRLTILLAALLAAVALTPGAHAADAQKPVGAFLSAVGALTGADGPRTPSRHQATTTPSPRIAAGCCVAAYAGRNGAEFYKGTPPGLRWLPERAQVGLNRRWLRSKMKKGYDIEDIGPDPRNARRSPFYEGEHRTLGRHGYPNYRQVDPGGG